MKKYILISALLMSSLTVFPQNLTLQCKVETEITTVINSIESEKKNINEDSSFIFRNGKLNGVKNVNWTEQSISFHCDDTEKELYLKCGGKDDETISSKFQIDRFTGNIFLMNINYFHSIRTMILKTGNGICKLGSKKF